MKSMVKNINSVCVSSLVLFFLLGCGGGSDSKDSKESPKQNTESTKSSDLDNAIKTNNQQGLLAERGRIIGNTDSNYSTIVTVANSHVADATVASESGESLDSLGVGLYGFKSGGKYPNQIKLSNAWLDINHNNTKDNGEPSLFDMYTEIQSSDKEAYINLLTTLSHVTGMGDASIKSLLNISGVSKPLRHINTELNDLDLRRAVLYAGAILGEIRSRSCNYILTTKLPTTPSKNSSSQSDKPSSTTGSGPEVIKNKTILPRSQNCSERVLKALENRKKAGMSIGDALQNMTGDAIYSSASYSFNVNSVNEYILIMYDNYARSGYSSGNINVNYVKPNPKPNDIQGSKKPNTTKKNNNSNTSGSGTSTNDKKCHPAYEDCSEIKASGGGNGGSTGGNGNNTETTNSDPDGYIKAKEKNGNWVLPSTQVSTIEIDRIAFYEKSGNGFKLNNSKFNMPPIPHDAFPSNFDVDINELNATTHEGNTTLDLSSGFDFKPTSVRYK